MLFRTLIALCVGLLLGAQPAPLRAQILWSTVDEVIQVRVRPGWREPSGQHVAALEFRLAPGWKTYWRSPGAAGIAPEFNWKGSRNLGGLEVHWPVPKMGKTADVQTLGYFDRLVLPLLLEPERAGAPIRLKGRLDIGVCADICLPAHLSLSAVLPASGTPDPEIIASLSSRPALGTGTVRCVLTPGAKGLTLSADIPLRKRLGNSEVVAVEMAQARGQVWITDTETHRTGATLKTRTEFMVPAGSALAINRADLRFTVVGARGAVEYFGCTR